MTSEPAGWPLGGATLRRLVLEDAPDLFTLVDSNRARLRPWLDWEDAVRGVEDVSGFIEGSYALGPNGPSAYECGIFEETSGRIAGAVGLNAVDLPKKTANLGYWVGGPYEGRGWMTAATRALTRFGFEVLKLERIEIRAAEANVRSVAVAERAGFKREGLLRSAMLVDGVRYDVVVLSKLPTD